MKTITDKHTRDDFKSGLESFKRKIESIKLNYTDKSESIKLDCGEEIAYINDTIKINFCSLDDETSKRTILNVVMEENGYILPHKHDRVEVIFVIEGKIKDKKTGVITSENKIYVIPENQDNHIIALQKSLLTLSWKPKYEPV